MHSASTPSAADRLASLISSPLLSGFSLSPSAVGSSQVAHAATAPQLDGPRHTVVRNTAKAVCQAEAVAAPRRDAALRREQRVPVRSGF